MLPITMNFLKSIKKHGKTLKNAPIREQSVKKYSKKSKYQMSQKKQIFFTLWQSKKPRTIFHCSWLFATS